MAERPLFSIITVCRNAGIDLLKTAESLKAQNFTNYEYIIKDGWSDEETLTIAKNIRADKFVVKPDKGIFDAMNQAIDLCSGRYINFMNAGDLFPDKHVLSVVAEYILMDPEPDLLYGDVIAPQRPRKYVVNPDRPSRYFLYTRNICHQAIFVKRELFHEIGNFDTSHPIGGDYVFLLRAFLDRKVIARHVRYFVAVYKGQGISSDPLVSKESEKERDVTRRDLFHRFECALYPKFFMFRNMLRSIFYDTFMFKLHRKYNKFKCDALRKGRFLQ